MDLDEYLFATWEEAKDCLARYARASGERPALSSEQRFLETQHFFSQLGNPQDQVRVIHVAGTSGKGSTSAYIDAILRAHGFFTGLSVSPHVSDVRERFQLAGHLVSEICAMSLLQRALKAVSVFRQNGGIEPSYGVLMRGMTYSLFAEERVDYAVVETGIGGKYDSSNVANRSDKFCVITRLGFDHMQTLGETIEKIADQKLGIVYPGNEVVIGAQTAIDGEALEQRAKQRGASAVWCQTQQDAQTFLEENAALARAACSRIAKRDGWVYDEALAVRVCGDLAIPLRLEQLAWKGKTLLIDAAHNPQKAEGLAQALRVLFPHRAWALLFATNPGTDVVGMLRALLSASGRVGIADVLAGEGSYQFHFSDPLKTLQDGQELASHQEWKCLDGWDACLRWIETVPEPVVVITGSFHFAAFVREQLLKPRE